MLSGLHVAADFSPHSGHHHPWPRAVALFFSVTSCMQAGREQVSSPYFESYISVLPCSSSLKYRPQLGQRSKKKWPLAIARRKLQTITGPLLLCSDIAVFYRFSLIVAADLPPGGAGVAEHADDVAGVVVGAVVGLAGGGHLVGARGPGRPCPNCEQRVILILLPRVQLAVPTAICRTSSEPSSVFLVQSSREWNISLIFGMRRRST